MRAPVLPTFLFALLTGLACGSSDTTVDPGSKLSCCNNVPGIDPFGNGARGKDCVEVCAKSKSTLSQICKSDHPPSCKAGDPIPSTTIWPGLAPPDGSVSGQCTYNEDDSRVVALPGSGSGCEL